MKILGRTIELNGNELARAIDVYLLAQNVVIDGPRTIRIATAGGPCTIAGKVSVSVYMDPAGRVIHDGQLVIDRKREGGR